MGFLRRLVRHAYEQVPFFRERFDSAQLLPDDIRSLDDFRKLPPMSRHEAWASSQTRTSKNAPKSIIKKTTGGTTGEPLLFGYEHDSEYWRQAIKMRGYGWAGHRLG